MSKLSHVTKHVRSQALRYYLEFEDKGRIALTRRSRKAAAVKVLHAVDAIAEHVPKETQDQAHRHVRLCLLGLAVKDS